LISKVNIHESFTASSSAVFLCGGEQMEREFIVSNQKVRTKQNGIETTTVTQTITLIVLSLMRAWK